ncbi:MAG: hypothetical protein ACI4PQ_00510 [Butyricicoccaceae bacterium]
MTEPLFFDADCISAFLWTKEQSILAKMYPGRIGIPRQTYEELSAPTTPHLRKRIDQLIADGQAQIVDIFTNTEAYSLYLKMTEAPAEGHRIIGRGEAACLALAKMQNGTIASNNLRDIRDYVTELGVDHITTGDIMVNAYYAGLITEDQGNEIWASMLKKRRKIGAASFSEYLRSKATAQLMAEIDRGWESAEEGGWLTLDEVESQLGLTDA